jgi:hypothetical protein
MDWMDCATAAGDCVAGDTRSHQPRPQSITNVITAFRNAIAHQNVLNFNGGDLGCSSNTAGTNRGDFDTVKEENFNDEDARRYAFHYALSIHVEALAALTPGGGGSGCGEIGGNDFYISFGEWGAGRPTVQEESGTIMHELGHNLSLLHGGGQGDNANNFKPNYLSIMNYSSQLRGIPATNRLDYSRSDLPI